MRWPAALLAVALGLPIAPAGVAADPDPDADRARARELYQVGRKRFEAGDLDQAIDAFQRGYRLDPRPEFLLNLAQSYRALGRRSEAIAHFERFIAAAPDHELRPAAEKTLAELRREEAAARAAAAPPPRPVPLVTGRRADTTAPPPARRSRLWIWAAAGAAVLVGGAAAVYLATRDDSPELIDTVPLPP